MSENKKAQMPYSHYEAACNKIREKTGKTEPILSGELADEIASIGGYEDGFLEGTLTSYENKTATKLASMCFRYNKTLKSAKLYNILSIGEAAFDSSNVEEVIAPKALSIGNYAFTRAGFLKKLYVPEVKTVAIDGFFLCQRMEKFYFPKLEAINGNSFRECYSLKAFIMERTDKICVLNGSIAFDKCYHFTGTVNATYNPEGLKDGYFYVPRVMLDSYKTATNWIAYQDRFRAIEDYPEVLEGVK